MRKRIKQITAISLVLLIVALAFIYTASRDEFVTYNVNGNGGVHVGGIYEGKLIEQSFTSAKNELSSLQICVATFGRVNRSSLTLQIRAEDGAVLREETVPTEGMKDNSYYTFSFSPIEGAEGKKYTLAMYSDASTDGCITAWTSNVDAYKAGELYIDGHLQNADLTMKLGYRVPYALDPLMLVTALLFAAILILNVIVPVRRFLLAVRIILWTVFSASAAYFFASVFVAFAFNAEISTVYTALSAAGFKRWLGAFVVILPLFSFLFFKIDFFKPNLKKILSAALLISLSVLFVLFALASVKLSVSPSTDGSEIYTVSYGFRADRLLAALLVASLIVGLDFYFKWHGIVLSYFRRERELISSLASNRLKQALHISSLAVRCVYLAFAVLMLYLHSRAAFLAFALATGLCLALWLVDLLWVRRSDKYAFMFLICSLMLGYFMSVTQPMANISWDDQIHFATSVNVANELSGADMVYEGEYLLATIGIPNSFNSYYQMIMSGDNEIAVSTTVSHDGYAYTGGDILKLSAYAPVILVLLLKRLTGIQFFMAIILSKFANCILYASVLYFGLRKMKSGSLIFSALLLMPLCTFLTANYSYDYWVNAFIGFAFAYFIGINQDREHKITYRDIFLMAGAMLIGSAPKAIYIALILPFFFMPKEKFDGKTLHRNYHIAMVLAALPLVLPYFTAFLSGGEIVGGGDLRGGSDVSSGGQIAYILKNPVKYAGILLGFLARFCSIEKSVASCGFFAYISPEDETSAFAGTLILGIVIIAALCDGRRQDIYKNSAIIKSSILAASFLTTCLVATALYISFTPVGLGTVNGVQWRYLIPMMLPSFYCVSSLLGIRKSNKTLLAALVFAGMTFATLYECCHDYILI